MENKLQLVKSKPFGEIQCDFYGNGEGEFYMTREQIGRALEYGNPRIAVSNIHDRHKDRLGKHSAVLKLSTPSGKQETTVYTRKGIMEICRWSQQPKADAFMDFTWEVMDSLMSGKATITSVKSPKSPPLSSVNNAVKIMTHGWEEAGIDPKYQVLMLTQIYRNAGLDLLDPPLTVDEPTYDLTAMAKELGVMSQASKGKEPHAQAIGAIVSMLDISESLVVRAPFSQNGHSDDYDRYKAPVLMQVREWLEDNGYPSVIHGSKNFKVVYQKVSAAA